MDKSTKGKISSVGTRIRQWRKSLPLKGYELAKIIKISQGSLSDLENNKSLPSADTIVKLHMHTNVNILWLLTGKGVMIKSDKALAGLQGMNEGDAADDLMDNSEIELLTGKVIRIYNSGDSEKIALLRGFLEGVDVGPEKR
ncbi:MAG: helix-turn-helix domain-containing protein [Nitrospinota bacterium]|nr:helix-turn-helix domain-containing protein [Nitrospinota bacterium]